MAKKTKKEKKAKTPSIPLEHINYRSTVNGTFARVKCIQRFKNDAQNPVEAVYVFPMPDEATVTACVMRIGKRKVEAELKKRKEARKEYEEAIEQGHHASLLEQERPNIFTMNVGGVEPGEKISVEIDYIQRIPWQAGGGRFSIPLVVAPRFIPGTTPVGRQAGGWSPDTDEVPDASRITPVVAKEDVSYDADISVMFSPGFRCKLSSPSHGSMITEQEVKKADTIELKTGDIRTDRNFILVYKSLSRIAEITAHVGEFNGESFMLTSIIPPGDVTPVGSDIVFVLDCSGSMHGAKIEGLKVIVKKIVRNLKKQNVDHHVGIVPFDTNPWPEHPVGEINETTDRFIDSLESRGGTCLGYALQKAESILSSSQHPKVMLMVTDGDTEHGRNWQGKNIRLIGVGIDTAVNDERIKDLTRRNNGTAEFVFPGEDYDAIANRMAGYVSGPVLQSVKVETKGDVVGVSDVFKGRPATISARFNKEADISITVSGQTPDNATEAWTRVKRECLECDFAAQIWARDFIRENQDEQQQTEVSLKYGVICKHTSFVAVSLKEVPGKKPERVEIPVNLPVGWDYESVFGTSVKGVRHAFMALSGPRIDSFFGSVDDMSIDATCVELAEMQVDDVLLESGPPISPATPSQPVMPGKFVLDAKDFIDRMIGILIAVSKGQRNEAEKAFAKVKRELTAKRMSRLNPTKRAMACYFAARLTMYGLKFSYNIMAKLPELKGMNDEARAWLNLALKEGGRPFKAVVPSGIDASEYIAWKLGKAERPQSGEWSLVP